MADVSIVIGAQDMATAVLENISAKTRVMTASVTKMASSVTQQTQAMSVSFKGLMMSFAPLLAAMVSFQAVFAVFRFGADSVNAFVEAGSPAGKELGASMKLASDAIHSLMVTVGALLAPFVKVISQGLVVFAQTAIAVLTPAIGVLGAAFEGFKPYIDMFLRSIIAVMTGAEVIFTNLGEVWGIVVNTIALRLVQMAEEIKYYFMTVMPAYIVWFGENFVNIIRDAAVGAWTVLQNLGKNLGEFGAAIYKWVTGGMQGGVSGLMAQLGEGMYTSLLDGFEAQTSALPEIAARQITGAEQALAQDIGRAGANLGQQFNEKFQERVGAMTGQLALPEMAEPAKAEETTKKLTGGLTAVAESQSEIAQQLSATESRLLTRGPSEGPMQSVAQASQKTAEAAEKTQQSSDRMVQLLEQLLARNFIVAEPV